MNYTIYIASELDHVDRFFGEDNKSGLINRLLKEHYGAGNAQPKKETVKPKIIKTVADAKKVAEIIKKAKCDGQHYMFRSNCGEEGCPWA